MNINININTILTTLLTSVIIYLAATLHDLEIDNALMNYKIEQLYPVLQEFSENIDNLKIQQIQINTKANYENKNK
jgi:hypothetical protein